MSPCRASSFLMDPVPHQVISTILRHDAKQTSYKIALVRAINDVALAFPDLHTYQQAVIVPLRLLAEYWIAYYWPFVDPTTPILQGVRASWGDTLRQDMAFRPGLTRLRTAWQAIVGVSSSADGFYLIHELRVPRRRQSYQANWEFLSAYDEARGSIEQTLQMPIRYAGSGQWSLFAKPARWQALQGQGIALPGTAPADLCLVIPADLWVAFRDLSLWIEALCLHEWCLFTERVQPQAEGRLGRGVIYELLTARPDNRRPLTWEQNQIDLLLLEGKTFVCPWTERPITHPRDYDIDHLVPISLYPIHELWNLVPSDPHANSHLKRDRLPEQTRLRAAEPHLALAYGHYLTSPTLAHAIEEDAGVRFASLTIGQNNFADQLAHSVIQFMDEIAVARNVARF
jgi:hypothetical protein